jgi:hypothetical protein
MNSNLNKEEKEVLKSYDNDEWASASNPSDIARYKAAAKNTFKKNNRGKDEYVTGLPRARE